MIINGNAGTGSGGSENLPAPDLSAVFVRIFGWATLAFLTAFLLNNYLTFWAGWPGVFGGEDETDPLLFWVQVGLYVAAVMGAAFYVLSNPNRSLRLDRKKVSELN